MPIKLIGTGTFGAVYKMVVKDRSTVVAVKRVPHDRRSPSRELEIMLKLSEYNHPNIVQLLSSFYSPAKDAGKENLNFVMPHMPCDLSRVIQHYVKSGRCAPLMYTKLYTYQLARALLFIHSFSIVHRDIKPQNVLLDPQCNLIKLCDFGSAKVLRPGEPNISYISSRHYRAPELIFDASNYTTSIDVWSFGCIVAELLLGEPLFCGQSSLEQVLEIITIIGTPSKSEFRAMNPEQADVEYDTVQPYPLENVFGARGPADVCDMLSKIFRYDPSARSSPLDILGHAFFDDLRSEAFHWRSNTPLPPLFDFLPDEERIDPCAIEKLIPKHLACQGEFGTTRRWYTA